MINIDNISNTLKQVQLNTDQLEGSIQSILRSANDAIHAHSIMEETGLLDLHLIATKVKTWKLNNLTVILDIPWCEQTRARHLYGGCFPENIRRDVITENKCGGDAFVFRRYIFKCGDDRIQIRFYRDTFDGDKVDGCKIETVYVRPVNHSYYPRTQSTPHLSISCPMKKGEYRYG